MHMTKKIIGLLFGLALFCASTFAAQLYVKPLYSDKRFPPVDKLHAGCMQNGDIMLKTDDDIREINVVMQFDPEKIDILRVLPDYKNKDEKIEFDIRHGEIVYTHKNMIYNPWYEIKIFSILFNTTPDIQSSDFVFAKGSYALTQGSGFINLEGKTMLEFAEVPECDPDIIPPSIQMLKPIDTASGIALDSVFAFDIKDVGKGVDVETIYVTINKDVYTINSMGVIYSGNTLVIQPRSWLPVDSDIQVRVAVSDKQTFGWANTSQKTFLVKTANEVLLDDKITPGQIRKQVLDIRASQWSVEECILLQNLATLIAEENREKIDQIAGKMDCELVLSVNQNEVHGAAQTVVISAPSKTLSLFAITGWVLFVITLILKVHYFVAYKKQQKFFNI